MRSKLARLLHVPLTKKSMSVLKVSKSTIVISVFCHLYQNHCWVGCCRSGDIIKNVFFIFLPRSHEVILSYNSHDISLENLVLDQIIIPFFILLFILITKCLLGVVLKCCLGHLWEFVEVTTWFQRQFDVEENQCLFTLKCTLRTLVVTS